MSKTKEADRRPPRVTDDGRQPAVAFRVDAELLEWLDAHAAREGFSRSAVVVRALRQYREGVDRPNRTG